MSPRRIAPLGGPWLAVALGLAAAAPFAAAETLVLTDATVHTVSGPTLERASILIRDGVIAEIGPRVSAPAGARVVSCAGKHVYPGFVSPNSVLGLTEVSSVKGTNDDAETGAINPNIRAEIAINPDSELLPVARANGITSVVVMPRGGRIAGTAAVMRTDGWTFEDMTLRAPAGLIVQWPRMHARTEAERKRRDQAIADIRDAFEDARAYGRARAAEGKAGVPRHDADVKWDALARAVRGEIPVIFRADTLAEIRAALNFADAMKLSKVTLLGAHDTWRIADEIRTRGIPVIVSGVLDTPVRPNDAYDARYSVPAKLHRAGVAFCIGDDGGRDEAMNARNLPYHAAAAAAFGLPREEALKAVTLYPARIFGVDDRVGSIEVGKQADLFVADGDPLEITTRIEQVFVAGRATSMENRQSRLFQKFDGRPRGKLARPRHGGAAAAEATEAPGR
jgi:imidazolonepropionase-like amidohydrolase